MDRSKAWVTLITKPSYIPGVLVLSHSLQKAGSRYPCVAMITKDLPKEAVEVLKKHSVEVVAVDRLSARKGGWNIKDERFADTWTKLRCFQLTQFDRVALIDSDMLVLKNMDELMEMDLEHGWIAAAHVCACNPRKFSHYPRDWVPENCAYSNDDHPPDILPSSPRPYGQLNGGLVVLRPSIPQMETLRRFLEESPLVPTFAFPDQDLLSEVYRGRWKPLPYIYNALKPLRTIHSKLWRDEEVKNVHYIFAEKPWHKKPSRKHDPSDPFHEVHLWWWDSYGSLRSDLLDEGHHDTVEYLRSYVAQ